MPDVKDYAVYFAGQEAPPAAPTAPFGTVREVPEAAAAAPNEYAEYFAAQDEQEAQARKFTAWRASQPGLSPDDAADVVRHSAATGLAPEFVAANLPAVRQSTSQAQLEQALQRQPQLARYMADAAKAPIVRDDVANLGPLEWLLTGRYDELKGYTPPAAVRAFQSGLKQQQIAVLGARQLIGRATPEDDAELRRLTADTERDLVGPQGDGVTGWLRHKVASSFVGGIQMLPYLALSTLARTVGGFAGGAAAGAATAGIGAPAGAVAGSFSAGAAFDFFQNVGGLYGSLHTLKGADGAPLLSNAEARSYAIGTSLATSVLTAGIGGKLVTAVPGVKELLAKATQQSIGQALATQTVGTAAIRALKGYGEHVAAGAAFMAVQASANGAAVEIAKGSHGLATDWTSVRDVAGQAFLHGVRDMALLGAWAPGRQFLGDVGRNTRLAHDAAALSAMTEQAKASKLAERSPEEAQALLGTMARAGDTPNVFVDKAAWDKLWQEQKQDPREASAEVTGSHDAYDHAQATGGDLVIPTGAWLAKVARSKQADPLREHVKLTEDGLTPAQAQDAAKAIADRAKALAKAEPVEGDAMWSIRERERAKALAAGADDGAADAFAAIRAANVQALAERYGGSVGEWYGRLGNLEIRGPGGKGLVERPMEPGTRLEQSAWEAHLSNDPLAVTQEMTPLDIKGVGLPEGGKVQDGPATLRVSLGEAARRTGAVDPLAQTQEMAPLKLAQKERGFIEFAPAKGGEPLRASITLLSGADRSTLAHETGHFLTEALSRIAGQEGAPEALRADMDALAKFAGYGSLEERAKRLVPAKEEQISHAWEQYLAEGKAPSAALAGVFARFKQWLTAIYKGVQGIAASYKARYGDELLVSAEARRVFDRWLASEHEVNAAQRAQEAQPFPTQALKLSPVEAARYDKALAQERQAAEATVLHHLANAEKGAARDFVAGERERIAVEVGKELDASPVQRLRTYLLEGHDPGIGPAKSIAEAKAIQAVLFPDGQPMKLSRKDLAERYGADFYKSLPAGASGKNGVHPDFLAEHFGFGSGDEMVKALQASEPRDVVLERETQRRLQEAHPEPAGEVADVALSTTHDDATANRVLLEARALRRQLDPTTDPRAPLATLAALKATAERLAGERKVGDLQPGYYLQAERSAAKAAIDDAAEGKLAEAYDAKEQQLLAMQMWRAARDAREQADKDVAALRKFTETNARAKLGKAGPEFLAQVDGLLSHFELGASVNQAETGRRAQLQQWLANEQAAGRDPIMPASVLAKMDKATHWKDLTSQELADLRDGVESIAHQAELAATVLEEGKRVDRAQAEAALVGDLAGREAKPVLAQDVPRTVGERLGAFVRTHAYGVAKVEELLRQLGPAWTRLVWNPINDSTHEWSRLTRETGKAINDTIGEMPAADQVRWRETRFTVAGQPYDLTAALAVALNMGNASNARKLLEGWQHDSVQKRGIAPWTDATPREFLAHLTARDAQLVQTIWDRLESLWPASAALEQKLTGLVPPKVEAQALTFRTADGQDVTLKGGYYPLVYDPRFPGAGPRADEAAALGGIKLFDPGYYRAATPQGRLQERVESYARPIALNIDALPRKISESAKDIAFREAALSVHKLLTSDTIRAELQQRAPEAEPVLLGWLRDVVNDQVVADNGSKSWLSDMSRLRSNFTAGLFAYNIGQTIQNLAGFTVAARAVGFSHMTDALMAFAKDRAGTIDQVTSLSAEMRERSLSAVPGVGEALRDLGERKGAISRISEFGLAVFEATDKAVAFPTWLAAFRRASAEGQPQDAAVRFADQTVRLKVAGGMTKDMPALTRNQMGKWLAPLMGFAIGRANQVWGSVADARLAASDGHKWAAAKIIGATLAAIAAESILSELVTGKGPKDENDDGQVTAADWAHWTAKTAALSFPKMVPVLGTVVRSIEAGRDVSFNPETRALTGVAKTVGGTIKLAASSDPVDADAVMAQAGQILETAGWFSGLPVAQASTTVKYLNAVRTGDEQPTGPVDAALGVAYGKKRPGKLADLVQ